MTSYPRRVARRLTGPVRQAAAPAFEQLEVRLLALDEKLDRINHLVAAIETESQDNRHQILAARHEAHVLMVTDIDAANEATALLGRSLADHRELVEERLDRLEAQLVQLTEAVHRLGDRAPEPSRHISS